MLFKLFQVQMFCVDSCCAFAFFGGRDEAICLIFGGHMLCFLGFVRLCKFGISTPGGVTSTHIAEYFAQRKLA